ncbi:uncharacterized protein LOC124449783 isoform X2 [Xenia sp. Carnegie-2017]|uniref:uncharacterized protein LOC124449783 isoform X2 n=1 Tax=Xenia sp. Carnegie-2017 TaxID=2897299 RepID=UPI001F04DE39|nr:uncharacterized protein LOC124449783 isoform X2 [Xenia sp. Carnegie-2017]
MEASSSRLYEETSEARIKRRKPDINEKWKYIDESTKHRELLLKLIEYGRNPSVEVKVVGNVRVIFSEEFCIGKGRGGTRVFLGLGKDGYGKAVKRIHRHEFIQLAHHEKKILNEFNVKKSKYVVNYFYLEEDKGTDYDYLILDLCEETLVTFVKDSTLHDLQKALPDILRQILKGLADLHSGPNPILHRDLNPSNVLRDSKSNFLIADFGISRKMKNDSTSYKSTTSKGTVHWIAPESYCDDDDSVNKACYERRSDVYNAGMVAYYIATKGKHPFGSKRLRLDNMLNGNPVGFDQIKDETLKDLLSWMLKRQPEERPYSNEALKHPFFMSDDEKFEMLRKVGNLQQIKTNDSQSSVVQQLNSKSEHWKSKMDCDVYDYLVNGKPYKSSWTECLRLIRSIDQHWNNRPRPQPELFYKIGDYRAYFLRKFPNLPVWVHAAVRSNKELKNKPELMAIFSGEEKKKRCFQDDHRYTKLTPEEASSSFYERTSKTREERRSPNIDDDLRITNYDIPSTGEDDLDLMPLHTLGRNSPPSQSSESSVSELQLQEWKFIGESAKHRKMFLKLCEYGASAFRKVKHVGDVRVIFSDEFCIGRGNDGTRVFLGLTKDGYGKAVKRIHRDNFIHITRREKEILIELNSKESKYFVNYSNLEEDNDTEYVYLLLDLCEESLESFVKSSTLSDLQKALPEILRPVLQGLAYLHSGPQPILHCHLKPSNVLRDSQGKFLIADFGIKAKAIVETQFWIAPESYCKEEDSFDKARYEAKSDVMNAGMVAYYVATKGKHPFGSKPHRLINILNGKPVGLDEIKDETLKDLLSWMLKLQPEERPSANEALKHPFLMSDDEKFHFLCKVGDLQSIKTNDPQSSIVQQLNIESSNWKSQMDNDVYEYLVNGTKYGSSWTECLSLIRNIGQHWDDRQRPLSQPEIIYKIGDHKAYFLKTFPSLPARVHAALRSNDELKDNPEFKAIFPGEEKRCLQDDHRYTKLTPEEASSSFYEGTSEAREERRNPNIDDDHRYTKLTPEEIEKISQKVATRWRRLGLLLRIPSVQIDEIIFNREKYPDFSARCKKILEIFNEETNFDRHILNNCVEKICLDLDKVLSRRRQFDRESAPFSRLNSSESLYKDDHRYTKLTPKEIDKISQKVATRWRRLGFLLGIPSVQIDEIIFNREKYPDFSARCKKILEIFNEETNFDRHILNYYVEKICLDLDKVLSRRRQFDRESAPFSRLNSSESLYKDDHRYTKLTPEEASSSFYEGTSEARSKRRKPNIDEEWKYIDESTKHRELLLKLIEYGCNPSVEVKVVGNVRVIFSEEFCIGEGSDATRVFLGLDKDGYGKAVKRIHRDGCIQLAHHEKKILNEFNAKKSKYVVNYFYLEEDIGTDYVYLILDLCEESLERFVKCSTLHDLQKALPDILRQILKGLADLHSGPNPILHRDLRPTNVLRDTRGNFLIADFGISRILDNDSSTHSSRPNKGNEYWIAPESYCEDKDTVDKGRYKKASDVMNAGMVAYYVATKGKHPFGNKRFRLDNMLNGNPVGLYEIEDETLKDILSWMLKLPPEERPSANEALKHPFLMSDDEKFEMLRKVGNLQQIKTNDPLCRVVQQLNSESSDWKSQMDRDVYDYFRTDVVTGKIFKYGSSWTECLRLIRNINQHWNDRPRPRPQPEPFYKIGDYRAYFLRIFPNLPVRVHAAVRSNEELKNKPELMAIFSGEEKKKRCFQADLRYTKLTTEEIEKIGQKVGTDWNILGGLLEIPFDIRDEITVYDTIYPNHSAKSEAILVIFNERKKFDRYVLKKCLEEIKLDLDEILSPTNLFDGESQAFERIKSFSSLNKDTKATSSKVEKLVTSGGGNLMMEDVIFDIGPGCLEDSTMIKLVKVNNPSYIKSLLDLELLKSSICHLQCLPNGLHFSKPAPLQININGDRAISREDNGSLKIVAIYGSYSNDKQKTTWKFLEDIDVNEKRILININTFSSYIFVTAIPSYIPRILCHLNEFFYAYAYVFHRRSSKTGTLDIKVVFVSSFVREKFVGFPMLKLATDCEDFHENNDNNEDMKDINTDRYYEIQLKFTGKEHYSYTFKIDISKLDNDGFVVDHFSTIQVNFPAKGYLEVTELDSQRENKVLKWKLNVEEKNSSESIINNDKDDDDKKNSKRKGNETSDFSEQEASAIDVSHMDVDKAREGNNNHHKDERKTEGNETSDFSKENKSAFDVSEMDVDKLKQGDLSSFRKVEKLITADGGVVELDDIELTVDANCVAQPTMIKLIKENNGISFWNIPLHLNRENSLKVLCSLKCLPKGIIFHSPVILSVRGHETALVVENTYVFCGSYMDNVESITWNITSDVNIDVVRNLISISIPESALYICVAGKSLDEHRVLSHLNHSFNCRVFVFHRRLPQLKNKVFDLSVVFISEYTISIRQINDHLQEGYTKGVEGNFMFVKTDRKHHLNLDIPGTKFPTFTFEFNEEALDNEGHVIHHFMGRKIPYPANGWMKITQVDTLHSGNEKVLWTLKINEDQQIGNLKVDLRYTKLTTEEIEKIIQKAATDWNTLGGLLEIPFEKRDEINVNHKSFPNPSAKAKKILEIFNERTDFDRLLLKKYLGEINLDLDEILTPTNQTSSNEDVLTTREICQLSRHIASFWDELASMMNMESYEINNVQTDTNYENQQIKAEKILSILSKKWKTEFRSKLVETLESMNKFYLADSILNYEWKQLQ